MSTKNTQGPPKPVLEATSLEAKRFLSLARGVLSVPKSEIDAKLATEKAEKPKRLRRG